MSYFQLYALKLLKMTKKINLFTDFVSKTLYHMAEYLSFLSKFKLFKRQNTSYNGVFALKYTKSILNIMFIYVFSLKNNVFYLIYTI